MDKFDRQIQKLVHEYLEVEAAIARCRDTKRMCDEEIKIASKYIGEIKAHIVELMNESGVVSTQTEFHNVRRKRVPPKVLVDEDAFLPERFVRLKSEPNKEALKKALDNGETLDGVRLSNGGETVQIRRKSNEPT
jgi:phage host-nuclease inhibitor protein Gam